MLILSRKVNESIIIGDKIEVSIVDLKGDQVKLGIRAPRDVKVYRQEVYDEIQRENREAARASTTLPSLGPLVGEDAATRTGDGSD
jgi:carbon storage regulator